MKNITKILAAIALMVVSVSCEDFLQEEPKSFASQEIVLSSRQGTEQALNGVYQAFNGYYRGRTHVMNLGITSDEISFLQTNTSRLELQTYTFSAENGNLARAWEAHVYAVNRANIILDLIDEEYADLKGEALFLRAWSYFMLVRYYGSVPLITSIEQPLNLFPSKDPIADIYDQIIADFSEAATLMPPHGETRAPGVPGRGAAKSALAWVYLTRGTSEVAQSGDFQMAANLAKEVIETNDYDLIENYVDVFIPANENGMEDIWSIQFTANQAGWDNSPHADFSNNPNPDGINGFVNFALTNELYNTFEPGDERLDVIYKGEFTVVNAQTNEISLATTFNNLAFTNKYRDPENLNRNNHGTNMPLIRFANVLLIHAEAENEVNGPTTAALNSINRVRARANLNVPLSNLSQEALRQAIRNERFKEFHGEGIRWFDLQRWGIIEQRVEAVREGVDVPTNFRYFPIPQTEVDANPNLQN
ncbi:MAG: RagB/SusD family nutrient uptake outer membrane protein [Cyclobacteriaceae bacterium]|nr:RagB/SusD family nutrient uptake outer membrane protein [Cyclobacteriaceae bacterium]